MGRTFRFKVYIRRFARRHPLIAFCIRSFMIFSAAFGGAYGFIAGSTSPVSGYDPHTFAIGASWAVAIRPPAAIITNITYITQNTGVRTISVQRTSRSPSPAFVLFADVVWRRRDDELRRCVGQLPDD